MALKLFSERDYWNRVWIVQEFVVTGKIEPICGSKLLCFDSFAAGIIFLGYHKVRVTGNITALDVINSADLRAFVSTNINGASSELIGL
jgi:hypothetical protein